MNTARTATLLTIFFALMCVIQISLIARTLDKTRTQLSNRSTGAINTLTQIDRNLDQLLNSLVVYKNVHDNPKLLDEAVAGYQSYFDIFWGWSTVFKLRDPGETTKLPGVDNVLVEVNTYLQSNDAIINAETPLSIKDTDRIYAETQHISERFHDLGHNYFIALSKYSDRLKNSTKRIYWAFSFFAFMLVCTGTISTYSLMKANRRSDELIKQSEKTQQRLTQVVSELRSGKLESKAKDSFLAAASHDLRQPLHALGLFLGALEKHVQPAGRSIMEKAQQSSTALTRLLSSLLDLSRLDAGVVKIAEKDFPLAPLIQTLEQEFQSTALECNMDLDFDDVSHIVKTDRLLLDRVLRNLIENALTHSKGSVLKLSCTKARGRLALQLSDDGRGIPQHEQNDIFSEYYQIGNPERDRSKGLGIGLSIVHRLSELLGFDLDFSSQKNSGCTFTLHLKPGAPITVVPETSTTNTDVISNKSTLIALIEDELEIREGMEIMLKNMGYDIITADSASALIETMQAQQLAPDLLISDYRLRQNQTGDIAIKQIVAYLGKKIPAIIVTGDTSPKRVKEATLSGFTLLHKPVEPPKLLASIEAMLTADQAFAATDIGAIR